MNKNNFFIKFAHHYKSSLTSIIDQIEITRDYAIELLEPMAYFITAIIGFLTRLINVVFPILSIITCFITKYIDKKEIEEWGVKNPEYLKSGYFSKWSIKKFQERIKKELEEDRGEE